MKPITAIFFTACLAASLRPLTAQDTAGTVPVPAPIPSDTATPAPSTQATPPPLFPTDTPPPIVTKQPHSGSGGSGGGSSSGGYYSSGGDSESSSKNPPARAIGKGGTTQNIADNIAYRKAKTKALRDEKVQEALAEADSAKEDATKRAALKRYYTLLADRMLKIDGSIKKLIADRLKQSLLELNQNKVRPGDYPTEESAGR